LAAITELSSAKIPVGVMVAPVIPGLNDHEIPTILAAASAAGATHAGHIVLRLPYAVAPLFEQWLDRHVPDQKEKILGRIRGMRNGRLNDSRFNIRMRGEGLIAEMIHKIFTMSCSRVGLSGRAPLSTASFRRPADGALPLFE
jgi:DNA repair photolyase